MSILKKFFCLIVSMLVIASTSYAVEISVGGYLGIGLRILRGEDAKTLLEVNKGFYAEPITINVQPQVDLMLEVLLFLIIETGFGFKMSTFTYLSSGDGLWYY